MNHSNGENNRVKHEPMGKKEGEDKSLFGPVGLEGTFSIKNWING